MHFCKNITASLFFIIVLFLTGNSSTKAQTGFEGRVIYDLSYPTTMELDPVTMKKAPKPKTEVTLYIKGDKMRMETVIPNGKSINICDGKAETCVTLTETNGQKTAIFMDEEEMEEENENHVPEGEKAKSVKLEETREIAGFICRKEEITFSKKNTEMLVVYYTDRIKSKALNKNIYWVQKRCKRIPGLVLQYEILNSKNEIIYQLTAKEVITQPLADEKFEIPPDFKVVNIEKDLKQKNKK